MQKRRLYILTLTLCLVSYGWLFFNWQATPPAVSSSSICLFKNVTTIPCPACGTTRSVLSIYEGNVSQAILFNPMGLFAFIILIIAPLWLTYDVALKRSSFLFVYRAMEFKLKNKLIAVPLVAIVLANWIWNIMKGL